MKSIVLYVDGSSTVLGALGDTEILTAEPFGYIEKMRNAPQCSGFNGKIIEAAFGCYLLGNGYRCFSPGLRRFMSPDRLSPFGAGGLNCYVYCSGDPVSHVDPSGHIKILKRLKMFFGIGAASHSARAPGVSIPSLLDPNIKYSNFKPLSPNVAQDIDAGQLRVREAYDYVDEYLSNSRNAHEVVTLLNTEEVGRLKSAIKAAPATHAEIAKQYFQAGNRAGVGTAFTRTQSWKDANLFDASALDVYLEIGYRQPLDSITETMRARVRGGVRSAYFDNGKGVKYIPLP